MPWPIGSEMAAKTIGTVRVVFTEDLRRAEASG